MCGVALTEENQVMPEFFDLVDECEKRLGYAKKNTSLPVKPNYKAIDELLAAVNEKIVSGNL